MEGRCRMTMRTAHTKELAYRWILENASLNNFTLKTVRSVYENKLQLAWGVKTNAKTLRGMCEWLSEGHTMFEVKDQPWHFKDERGKVYRMEFFHGYFKGSTVDFCREICICIFVVF